ncbi:DUF3231 family protein [Bacillus sp. Marseille-Q1617]|uniref:DUF3231 family protein n=1 Tax=Bacillus sp. Marseille-Q1617 TaxID=2736887 RepID=UPI0020CA76D7|nr:DUF3231 family protein [Bacillus sp. Marseille-Q1617]
MKNTNEDYHLRSGQMAKQNIPLTTAEITALWVSYMNCSATICFYKYFLHHNEDQEIKGLLKDVLISCNDTVKKVKNIFEEEDFPVPQGFSDKDIDLTVPPLFTDLFSLSFIYRAGQIIISHYATYLTKVAREDITEFFHEKLNKTSDLYKKSLNLMISKGIYDRPPKMEYPDSVNYIKHQPSLLETWFGESRTLNAFELSELFFAIERNCIGMVMLKGFLQVSRDKDVKEYFRQGKKLSEKQIFTFNKVLMKDEFFPTYPVAMEVKNTDASPFSEKLMLFFISASNTVGLTTLCHAATMSMRKDLAVHYGLFVTEIMKYSTDGLSLLIKRGWMEQPPQAADQKNLYD